MPTTLKAGFQKLRENLEITFLQASTVATRQTNVRDAVRNELDVQDDFLTGSYMRNTMISPLSEADVDIFIVLSPKYYQAAGQALLLERMKRALLKTYSKSPRISRAGQAVTITFTDFQVDVVPAFNRQGGGFLIPDTVRKIWLATDPKAHVPIWTAQNKAHDDDLIPVVKMLKGWNKLHGGYLRSFYLETLALQIFQNVRISDYPSAVRFFLQRALPIVGAPLHDPAGYTAIRGLIPSERAAVRSRMITALRRARNAEAAEARHRTQLAFGYWRQIFGDYFPAFA